MMRRAVVTGRRRRGSATVLVVVALGVGAAGGLAPLQCGSEYDPATAMEERPGEALYELAGELKNKGEVEAWQLTLEHLIRRYPSSRFAATARSDLREAGIEPPAEP
jgi:hypothetical protein